MAKRRHPVEEPSDGPLTRLRDYLRDMEPARRAAWIRRGTASLLGLSLFIVLAVGFVRLQSHVYAMERFDRALALEWTDLPDWLALPENRRILDLLAEHVNLQISDRLLDSSLAERLGQALSAPDIGWVKSVERVTIQPDGVIAIKCAFRRPEAWVRSGKYLYLVDQEAVRLPGRYHSEDVDTTALLILEGVALPPPTVGSVWRGGDLAAGLKMAALLRSRAFRHQITAVLVENHDGRADRSRPYLELATDRPGARIRWGRPPEEEFGTEISAAQKVALLDSLYRQCGRVDGNHPYVDIRTWSDRVVRPISEETERRGRLLRG